MTELDEQRGAALEESLENNKTVGEALRMNEGFKLGVQVTMGALASVIKNMPEGSAQQGINLVIMALMLKDAMRGATDEMENLTETIVDTIKVREGL